MINQPNDKVYLLFLYLFYSFITQWALRYIFDSEYWILHL